MKKSVLKIIINIMIILVILVLEVYIAKQKIKTENIIENKTMILNIKENSIEVQEKLDIKMSKDTKVLKVRNLVNFGRIESAKIDGENTYAPYALIKNEKGIDINKNIELTYSLDNNNIKKYNDISILTINICPRNFDYIENIDITINFDRPNNYFNIEDDNFFKNIEFTKISNNKFQLHIDKWNKKNIYVYFDSNQTKIGETINSSYYNKLQENKNEYIKENKLDIYICICFIITLISYIIYFVIKGRNKKTRDIKREWNDLISPILAETIIDGKIDVKNLIMTVITDLVTRGNIEVINNEYIKLLNKTNITAYENKIVDLIFENNDVVYFSNFKDIFMNFNSKTEEMYIEIESIKKDIINELNDKKILDKKKKIFMKIIKIIITVNIIAIPFIMSGIIEEIFAIILGNFLTFFALFLVIRYRNKSKNITFIDKIKMFNNTNRKARIKISILLLCILIIGLIVSGMDMALIYNIGFIILLLLDIIFLIITKKEYLTKKGKEERIKIIKFKNYIEQYSIINERDMKDIIIWDKYLVYATAFGITSKVTEKMYEGYYNTNITLQKIANIIKII